MGSCGVGVMCTGSRLVPSEELSSPEGLLAGWATTVRREVPEEGGDTEPGSEGPMSAAGAECAELEGARAIEQEETGWWELAVV